MQASGGECCVSVKLYISSTPRSLSHPGSSVKRRRVRGTISGALVSQTVQREEEDNWDGLLQ